MSEEQGLSTTSVLLGAAAGVATLLVVVLARRKKGKRCTSNIDLTGKTAIVTGANTGIGFWTARDFAARNAKVILACRSLERGETAREKIMVATGNKNVVVRHLDLFDFTSVRTFVEQILQEEDRLDILVNNAGVIGLPQMPSEHGLEITMATNHFGPFLLTLLLLDLLKKSAPSRIVNVSSGAQLLKSANIDFDNLRDEKPLSSFSRYAASKLANVLFTRELARRLEGSGVTTYTLTPGMVATEIGRNMPNIMQLLFIPMRHFLKTSEEGAQTSIYLAVSDDVKEESGKYYINCALAEDKVNPLANDTELARKLWEVSAQLTDVSGHV